MKFDPPWLAPYLDELRQQAERMREYASSQDYRAIVELGESARADSQRYLGTFTAAISSLSGEYDLLRTVARDARYESEAAFRFQENLQAIGLPNSAVIDALQDQLRRSAADTEALRRFGQTFAGRVMEAVTAVAAAPEARREETIERVVEVLSAPVESAKGKPIGRDLVLFALGVLMHVQGQLASRASENRILSKIEGLKSDLREITDRLAERPLDLRLVAANVINVRREPSDNSDVITQLWLNSIVRVLSEQGDWTHVEYLDVVSGKLGEGWVAARYLRALPGDFASK